MGVLAKLIGTVVVLGVAAAGVGWYITGSNRLEASEVPAEGDATRGERIFWAGGCVSCHARPKSTGDALLELAGGVELNTPFGKFVAPNISSDPTDGIGKWSVADFANAMLRGVSPAGEHYYPAFPYASYARMNSADVGDLYAFMKTLPAVAGKAPDHELDFPFNIRRGLGLWKLINLSPEPVVALAADAPEPVKLGRYLVEGPGHCGECHTPRDFMGGAVKAEWLAGAAAAEGQGNIPNLTPHAEGLTWTEGEIVTFLTDGTTPDFDVVGGSMAEVVSNMSKLSADDRAAIAAYLKAIPAHPNGYPAKKPAS
ncbi:MAG: cytochrome c [Rhizobiaceae bacterium]